MAWEIGFAVDGNGGDVLVKVGMFVLVQALVYLILSNSSNIFSKSSNLRSISFRTARSVSIRRMLAALSDLPAGGEQSPASAKSLPGCETLASDVTE